MANLLRSPLLNQIRAVPGIPQRVTLSETWYNVVCKSFAEAAKERSHRIHPVTIAPGLASMVDNLVSTLVTPPIPKNNNADVHEKRDLKPTTDLRSVLKGLL